MFSHTKWNLRSLTAAELLAVYDIPQQERTTAVRHRDVLELPFLRSAPLKALHLALSSWSSLHYPQHELPLLNILAMASTVTAYPKDCFDRLVAQAADSVAVKSDDVVIPMALWDEQVWQGFGHTSPQQAVFEERYGRSPLDAICRLGLLIWRRNVRVSYFAYMRSVHGLHWATCAAGLRDRTVGRDCFWRIAHSNWWDWSQGSTLFFWRWPQSVQLLARDRHPVWWLGELPRCMQLQPKEKDVEIRSKVQQKLQNVREKRYILPGSVACDQLLCGAKR